MKVDTKKLTDMEIRALIDRAELENRLKYVTREVKDNEDLIVKADLSKSVKEATDLELRLMVNRLYKETEVLDLVRRMDDLKINRGINASDPVETMYHEDVDDFLAHFGVKGQRWGVRKDRKGSGISAEERELKTMARRDAIKRSPKLLYKYRNQFTKEELQEAVGKLKLEREIRSLKKADITIGAEYADAFLSYAKVANTAYTLYSSPLGNAMAKKLNLPVVKPPKKDK